MEVNFFPWKLSKNCTYDLPTSLASAISKKLKKNQEGPRFEPRSSSTCFSVYSWICTDHVFLRFELILGVLPILVPLVEEKKIKKIIKKTRVWFLLLLQDKTGAWHSHIAAAAILHIRHIHHWSFLVHTTVLRTRVDQQLRTSSFRHLFSITICYWIVFHSHLWPSYSSTYNFWSTGFWPLQSQNTPSQVSFALLVRT